MAEEIAYVLACDAAYVRPTIVAARSAAAHGRSGTHTVILGVDLSSTAVECLETNLGSDRVEVVPIRPESVAALPLVGRFPPAVWAPVLLGSLVPAHYDRVLWLDSDILVRRPLDDLIALPLGGMTVGASMDYWVLTHANASNGFWQAAGTPPGAAYFNSGVLLVDLNRWREEGIEEELMVMASRSDLPIESPDQDVLNAVLWNRWLPIPQQWNYPAQLVSRSSFSARIVHFFGTRKPWTVACENAHFQREYQRAARDVAWSIPGPAPILRRIDRMFAPQVVKDFRDRRRARMEP